MKSKLLYGGSVAQGRAVQIDPRSAAPSEREAVRPSDEARRHAVELMASLHRKSDGKVGPAGEGAEALAALVHRRFGETAPTVAAWCALLARSEGAEATYRMWTAVFKSVRPAR